MTSIYRVKGGLYNAASYYVSSQVKDDVVVAELTGQLKESPRGWWTQDARTTERGIIERLLKKKGCEVGI